MKLSEISTLTRILTKTNTVNFTAANLLILANNSQDRLVGKIISESAYSGWSFGDSNYAALPTGTKTLVNDQRDYQLMGDFAATGFDTTNPLLTVRQVSILDENGIYRIIEQITREEIARRFGVDWEQFQTTNGRPLWYVLKEDFIQLFPKPDNGVSVTLAAGLKIDFDRKAEDFTDMTSASVRPGIPPQAHEIIAYEAAHTFAVANNLNNVNLIKASWAEKEKLFFDFMARRNPEMRKVIGQKPILFT